MRDHTSGKTARFGAVAALAVALFPLAAAGQYIAPNQVSFTLEGCRNDGSITLPIDGKFVCPDPGAVGGNDSSYTTGNLGKGWNELDLVPHRLTTSVGNQAAATTTYNVIIAADHLNDSYIGYDHIYPDPLVFKDPRSHASCSVSAGAELLASGVTGGVDDVEYRVLTISQDKGTTCYFNWSNRLALGASKYSGASLQSYMFETANFQIGKRTISIPVREIKPQELRKDMSATQNADFAWNLSKAPTPANVTFANTCDPLESRQKDVKVRVEWTRVPAAAGKVLVITNVYARNPASRVIDVKVTDTIYGNLGAGEVVLDQAESDWIVVPANTELKVLTHTFEAASNVTGLNDLATAIYEDDVTGEPIPGSTTATASAQIMDGGNPSNATAIITDSESINGGDLKFAVDSVTGATGSFDNYPVLGTFTTGPVDWTSASQTASGYVEFNKTIKVEPYVTFSGRSLDDSANLSASSGVTGSANASVGIAANAFVRLTIVKTIPDVLQGSETVTAKFQVKNSSNVVVWEPQITFSAGQFNKSVTSGDLLPDQYTIEETQNPAGLVPDGGTSQTKDLRLPTCSGSVTFNNVPGAGSAIAQVKKITVPAGDEAGWEFKLVGPGTGAGGLIATTTGTGFVTFEDAGQAFGLSEGAYTITETLKAGYEFASKSGCEFTVDYPNDYGQVYQCQFTNKKLGKIVIKKMTDPAGGTGFGFTDTIASPNSFSLDHNGTKTFNGVSGGSPDPATYYVTEDDPRPGYDLYQLSCDDADSLTSLVDRKATIMLSPGETVTCTFYNRQRGTVTVKKTFNGMVDPSRSIAFNVSGAGGINVTDNTFGDADGLLVFGGVKLIAGETYKLCERYLPAGWTAIWQFPLGNLVTPYNPGASLVPPEDIGERCYDFTAVAGGTSAFVIDNTWPMGDARTPGYWKNWNACTNGNQALTAAKNGGAAAGYHLLEDVLPQQIGDLNVTTCADGVAILDRRDRLTGRKMASDAAYNLASALLAARANFAAGAGSCAAATTAAADGQALLDAINFTGTGSYLSKPKDADYALALSLAGTLDAYNNNMLCP